jgi:hypothetical protein
MAVVSLILTYLIAGVIGWGVSRKMKLMPGMAGWFLLVLATILAQWILRGTRVIDVFHFALYANHFLQGLFAGTLLGLLSRRSPRQPAAVGQVDAGSPGVRPSV